MTTDSTDLVRPERSFSDDELKHVESFSDALSLLATQEYAVEDYAKEYGTGFEVLSTDKKSRLIGVDFVALEWAFNPGDKGEDGFVSIALVTETGAKLILNDGSTGIRAQMEAVTSDRMARGASRDEATHGLAVRGGLRVSEYPIDELGSPLTKEEVKADPSRAKGTGATYYLAR